MGAQRDQTEEWKGWMQLMFLLYHYFDAKELYNGVSSPINSPHSCTPMPS